MHGAFSSEEIVRRILTSINLKKKDTRVEFFREMEGLDIYPSQHSAEQLPQNLNTSSQSVVAGAGVRFSPWPLVVLWTPVDYVCIWSYWVHSPSPPLPWLRAWSWSWGPAGPSAPWLGQWEATARDQRAEQEEQSCQGTSLSSLSLGCFGTVAI